ncbi:MAG TPA: chemotaxis protein CheB [Kofleriaceae bacterium]|jgi:two-component system CheB/CheR fusion protein
MPGRASKTKRSQRSKAVPKPSERAPRPIPTRDGNAFPIVGIGASAGGLEAIEAFLKAVPEHSGLAFVVVQHLDPTQKGMLVELLQRSTAMPVLQAKNEQRVEPEHVYVIPPNKDISLARGALRLQALTRRRGLNLPIDFFFRSLAEDQRERAIGVVLSGMGSDGTLGLTAIKEHAGATFVQSIESAKFDSMPRSAIDAGLADVAAPVEELPASIVAYVKHAGHIVRSAATDDREQHALDKIFVLLRAHTGNDFSLYKKTTILRRIERRMGLHQIDSIAHYVRFVRENPREIELLFKELLIGVTSFFRDSATWDQLKEHALPDLLASRPDGGGFRAWVPGCSTGEEAYSLAMVFREAIEGLEPKRNFTLQIFATDLDRDAIDRARQAIYPDTISADVSPERLRRFFIQDERGYRVNNEIREMVVFATQNIGTDPPFTKLDILSCRNLLIYLSSELQRKLMPLFHYALNPGGILMLGSSETIGQTPGMFAALDTKSRLYRKLDTTSAVAVTFPSSVSASTGYHDDGELERSGRKQPVNLQSLVDKQLLQRFAPLGMLCNEKGDLLYISGRAGKYLEPSVGKANMNVFAMAREGLRYELSGAFTSALHRDRAVLVRGIKIGANGSTQHVDLTVQRLTEPKELRGGVLIVLADVPEPTAPARAPSRSGDRPRVTELEEQLQRTREEVQTTREEMQTSQEELKSTNEELQSTNEELQSSNEELTTSKEEMQSLNEELQTVNHELQAKVDELSRTNNDMKNLLNSTDIATLFLDGELRIRRFTTATAKIIKLIPMDTGRSITDIATDLDYPELAEDAREVLRTLVRKERQAGTRDGRWFLVRIMPYRTLENKIDGLVLTFSDATGARVLETGLRGRADELREMAESLPNLVFSCRPDGACDYVNRRWIEYTGIADPEQYGDGWLTQVHPDDRMRARDAWRAALTTETPYDCDFRIRNRNGLYRWFKTRSIPIRDARGSVQKWYGTSTDVDDLKGT